MRGGIPVIVFFCLAQAAGVAAVDVARAEGNATSENAPVKRGLPWETEPSASKSEADPEPSKEAEPTPTEADPESEAASQTEASPPASSESEAKPTVEAESDEVTPTAEAESEDVTPAAEESVSHEVAPPVAAHPVVAIIRDKLTDQEIKEEADPEDLAALEAFYRAWGDPPVWVTDMGFTARGQAALFEIAKADEWGLEAKAFALPDAGALPKDEEAQALAEIKLDLAILKYARYARGGRHDPPEVSDLLDQTPPLRDPKTVIAEISAADAPATYLQSLHPSHEQFARLREALLKKRKDEDAKTTNIRRIIMNMERWRWMPEDLGSIYVWLNTPDFMLYVVKDGETIFEDKTLVGTIGYPTPVFTADMKTVVFNPDWVAPPSVLEDKLWPALKRKYYNILKSNKLLVSYKGKPVDPRKINWSRVNIHNFTFRQRSGPKNVLGKAKFLYPNKHIVYMHDTLPYRQKIFEEDKRAIGYGCVRMKSPRRLAEILLENDEEWPADEVKDKVKELWDKGVDRAVTIEKEILVHTTYFTVMVDDQGKVSTFEDLYGLDRTQAVAMFGESDGFPKPPPEPKPTSSVAAGPSRRTGPSNGFANSLGFLGD